MLQMRRLTSAVCIQASKGGKNASSSEEGEDDRQGKTTHFLVNSPAEDERSSRNNEKPAQKPASQSILWQTQAVPMLNPLPDSTIREATTNECPGKEATSGRQVEQARYQWRAQVILCAQDVPR